MIDALVTSYSQKHPEPLDPNYTPEQAIRDIQFKNLGAPNLAVIFPPWKSGRKLMGWLTDKLVSKGSAVINYDFHPQIMEPDVDRVLESNSYITDHVSKQLTEIQKFKQYESIHLIGISLGGVAMSQVAEKFRLFDKATFIASVANLADVAWFGANSVNLRDELEKQDVTYDELEHAWSKLNPINNTGAFRNKSVRFILSKSDLYVPSPQQAGLYIALLASGAELELEKSRMGHLATIVKSVYTLPNVK